MKAVGVKALKNNLSRYLREVRAGETVLVTDRDEVIAEIRQPSLAAHGVSRWEAFVNEQVRLGKMQRPTNPDVSLASWAKDAPRLPPGTLQEILDDTRSDRAGQ